MYNISWSGNPIQASTRLSQDCCRPYKVVTRLCAVHVSGHYKTLWDILCSLKEGTCVKKFSKAFIIINFKSTMSISTV